MIFRGTTPTFKLIIDDKDADLTTFLRLQTISVLLYII